MDNLASGRAAGVRPTVGVKVVPDDAGRDEPPCEQHHCPDRDCGRRLETVQPDEQDPNRLLGICRACETWHLIELDHRTGRYELRGVIAGESASAA